jgi:hypothetical protein
MGSMVVGGEGAGALLPHPPLDPPLVPAFIGGAKRHLHRPQQLIAQRHYYSRDAK